MWWILLMLVLCSTFPANGAIAQEALIERARSAMADKKTDLHPHGELLAHYADSLRTLDIVLATKCLELSGIAAFRNNHLDSALVRWQRGVQWSRQAREIRSESSLLNALAIGHTALGDVESALPIYERALELRETLTDTMGLKRTWANIAQAYSNMGRTAEALTAIAEEEKWLALVDDQQGKVGNAIRRAQILSNLGRLEEALLEGKRAVELATKLSDDNVRAMAAMAHGNILLDLGRHQEALLVLETAKNLMRQSGDDFSATFVEQSIISCLLMLDRPEEALTRVRVLIPEVEAAGQIPLLTVLHRFEGNALFSLGRLEESENILRAALVVFEERRTSLEDDRSRAGIFSASGELYSSLARCLLATDRMEEAFATIERSRGAVFRDHASGTVATIEELKVELKKNRSALILFNDPGNEPLVAFVLDESGLRTVDLGFPDSIAADAQAALRLLASGESLETCGPALARLEKSLAAPVLAAVDSKVERFSIIPPSFLAGFPLGVLRDAQGRGWGETRPLSYLPNASALLDLGSRKAPQSGVLAFADPTASNLAPGRLPVSPARAQAGISLPEARTEIAAITSNAKQRRVGIEATGLELRDALKTSLAVLHLATHAVVDPIDGGRSAVVLTGLDGVDEVTAREISTFAFQGDLVVLSGCSTFGEHRVLGEGWFGLPRSFLAAGARSVVSTLWDVDDRGARQFITAFYEALRQGAARDEALVQARDVCRRDGMPPRDWAAFVLTGVGHEGLAVLVQSDSDQGSWLIFLALAICGITGGIWMWCRQ